MLVNASIEELIISRLTHIENESNEATKLLESNLKGWALESSLAGIRRGSIVEIGKFFGDIIVDLVRDPKEYKHLFQPIIFSAIKAAHTAYIRGADYEGIGVYAYAKYSGKSIYTVCSESGITAV